MKNTIKKNQESHVTTSISEDPYQFLSSRYLNLTVGVAADFRNDVKRQCGWSSNIWNDRLGGRSYTKTPEQAIIHRLFLKYSKVENNGING